MGIDVRQYAMANLDVKRAACVGCGMCAHVCPRGVLKLENKATRGGLASRLGSTRSTSKGLRVVSTLVAGSGRPAFRDRIYGAARDATRGE